MDNLDRCPFCGGFAHAAHHNSKNKDDEYYLVMCAFCFARTVGGTAEEAIAAWNRRAKPDNPPLTLEQLQEMNRIDRIRNMSAQELASVIIDHDITDEFCKSDCGEEECSHEVECCVKWLEEEQK